MKRLLLVEDDRTLGETLKERLEREGYEVRWVENLADASQALHDQARDLIVLDVGLPDGSGFDFARQVRQASPVPFIFVTAQSGAEARLKGYEIGAEEYIPKPFHLKELLIRVRHVLENHAVQPPMEVSGVRIDFESMSVMRPDGTQERLPLRDFQILKLLVDRSPKVVSRDDILDAVWGEDKFPSNRTVDNIILRLRQTLGPEAGHSIRSVRGVGYQWLPEGASDGQ